MEAHGGGPTRSAYRYPCLGPAEEFVSREDGEVSAISQGFLHPWFFSHGRQRTAAYIGDDRESKRREPWTPTDSVKPTVSKLLGGPRGPRRCSRLRRSHNPRAWYGSWFRPP